MPLALDVKKIGDEGDSTLQLLLVAVTLLCGVPAVEKSRFKA